MIGSSTFGTASEISLESTRVQSAHRRLCCFSTQIIQRTCLWPIMRVLSAVRLFFETIGVDKFYQSACSSATWELFSFTAFFFVVYFTFMCSVSTPLIYTSTSVFIKLRDVCFVAICITFFCLLVSFRI